MVCRAVAHKNHICQLKAGLKAYIDQSVFQPGNLDVFADIKFVACEFSINQRPQRKKNTQTDDTPDDGAYGSEQRKVSVHNKPFALSIHLCRRRAMRGLRHGLDERAQDRIDGGLAREHRRNVRL